VNNKPQKNYILPGEIRDAILRYLYTKPHGEVRVGVHLLETLEELVERDPDMEIKDLVEQLGTE
jgi:hypothetical protein